VTVLLPNSMERRPLEVRLELKVGGEVLAVLMRQSFRR
tara:strand:+ start:2714 stop:2827 length:114 start_codon:yes stop_codon:yes gene_type:complete